MDIKKVVIIVDVMRFVKEDIERDIAEEGYKHDFFYANFSDIDVAMVKIKECDEVWVWGDCKDIKYYKVAKELGADIWQMKL